MKNSFVAILEFLLGIIALLFLFEAIHNTHWPDLISKGETSGELWQIAILAITALVALIVYQSSKQVDESRMLIELREDLNSERNRGVHLLLEERSKQRNKEHGRYFTTNERRCDLYNYIGTLEMFNILIEKDIISEEAFKNQFGYRIRNIVTDHECVMIIGSNCYDWDDFISLVERFPEYEQMYRRTKRNIKETL